MECKRPFRNLHGRKQVFSLSENLVHRSGEGNNALFKVMVIEIPDNLVVEVIEVTSLKKDWHTIDNYVYCQSLGSKWLD
jgi:hypothetical protein